MQHVQLNSHFMSVQKSDYFYLIMWIFSISWFLFKYPKIPTKCIYWSDFACSNGIRMINNNLDWLVSRLRNCFLIYDQNTTMEYIVQLPEENSANHCDGLQIRKGKCTGTLGHAEIYTYMCCRNWVGLNGMVAFL